MAVDLPITGFSGIGALPALGINSQRSEGGLVITSRRADPYWSGRLTSGPLSSTGDNERASLIAWLYNTVELNLRVDWVHPRHRLPRAYTAATWPMVGNASLVDVPDLRTIVVSGLTDGLVLQRGDRLSIMQDDIIIHRWISADLVVSSAISQSIALTPRLPIGVLAPAAAVVLEDPKMRFMIVPESWRDSAGESYGPSPISFDIQEALR